MCCVFRYLNAIQTMCPHILRYLTTAVITNKDVRKRRQVLKDLVKVIQQVSSPTVCTVVLIQTRWMKCFLLYSAAGVVHVQRPNHRVCGVSLCQLWLRQRPEEAEGVWIGEHSFLLCLHDSVRLSRCTDLNRPTKVSHLLGLRADGKLLLATVLWSPESLAFNFAAIQPQQIHVWPDLLAFNFIQFDLQSGTAVRFRAWLPSL